jgi:hypothetical protein
MRDLLENGIKVFSYHDTSEYPTIAFGLKQKRFTLGEDGDPTRPILIVTHFPPNSSIPRHCHGDVFMDVVAEGASLIDGEWCEAGSVRWFPAKAMYGPVTAGPEGCILLEFYVDQPGFQTTIDEDAMPDELRAQREAYLKERAAAQEH